MYLRRTLIGVVVAVGCRRLLDHRNCLVAFFIHDGFIFFIILLFTLSVIIVDGFIFSLVGLDYPGCGFCGSGSDYHGCVCACYGDNRFMFIFLFELALDSFEKQFPRCRSFRARCVCLSQGFFFFPFALRTLSQFPLIDSSPLNRCLLLPCFFLCRLQHRFLFFSCALCSIVFLFLCFVMQRISFLFFCIVLHHLSFYPVI